MNMFTRVATATSEPFRVPYGYAVIIALATMALWAMEHSLNTDGNATFATYATLVSNVIFLIFGMAPLFIAYAGEFGALWASVNLRDPRTGAAQGVGIYFKLLLWIIFANTMVGLTLGMIPFGDKFTGEIPVFWNGVLVVVAAIIFSLLFDAGAKLKVKILTGALLLFAAIVVWNWIGPETQAGSTKSVMSSFTSDGATDAVTASDDRRPTIKLRPGVTQTVKWEGEGEPMFVIKTPGFDGLVSIYMRVSGTRSRPTLTLRDGVPELEVEVMTAAEASEIVAGTTKAKSGTDYDKLLNTKP